MHAILSLQEKLRLWTKCMDKSKQIILPIQRSISWKLKVKRASVAFLGLYLQFVASRMFRVRIASSSLHYVMLLRCFQCFHSYVQVSLSLSISLELISMPSILLSSSLRMIPLHFCVHLLIWLSPRSLLQSPLPPSR